MTARRHARLATAALALITWPCEESMAAVLDALAADGLYTWRVAAMDDAPSWCCFRWTGSSATACQCDLDDRDGSYRSSDDDFIGASGEMQIYALIESGKVKRLRALSPRCAVTSRRDITDLGVVDAGESVAWLESQVTPAASVSSDALAAISVHEGGAASLIRQGREDDDPEVRSEAWFWLAQTGASESEKAIQWAIEHDRDDEVREEAVFALSQLPDERGVDALLAIVGDRELQREVREQALFWLAQSDSDRAFEHLDRLLTNER
jgi:hypothetical protein